MFASYKTLKGQITPKNNISMHRKKKEMKLQILQNRQSPIATFFNSLKNNEIVTKIEFGLFLVITQQLL